MHRNVPNLQHSHSVAHGGLKRFESAEMRSARRCPRGLPVLGAASRRAVEREKELLHGAGGSVLGAWLRPLQSRRRGNIGCTGRAPLDRLHGSEMLTAGRRMKATT